MSNAYDIIISPIISEKSMEMIQDKKYTFKVDKRANKIEIKKAIEEAFGVKVVKINTANTKSKAKRVGRYTGKTKTYKKAYITLADGEKIEL